VDPYEETGHVIVAHAGGELVGTGRINFTGDGGMQDYIDLYECQEDDGFDPSSASIVTRFMVAKAHRSIKLGLRILWGLYDYRVVMGASSCYMDCNSHLVPYFETLGFETMRAIEHPEYGEVTVMRIMGLDREVLVRTGSPFLESLDRLRPQVRQRI